MVTAIEDTLRGLGPIDLPPSVADLGGEKAVLEAIGCLDAELLPRLIEAVTADWMALQEQVSFGSALAGRLSEVTQATSFATSTDALLAVAVAAADDGLSRTLMKSLLSATGDIEDDDRALRAGFAIRAAVDLSLLNVGVSSHGVLAMLEGMEDVPEAMAPGVARAIGRLWEHHDDKFLRELLEQRVLPHEPASADATVELGLESLRQAFTAPDKSEVIAALEHAVELFERARGFDEDRPDARGFAAGARAVLAFESDPDSMGAALDEMAEARIELDRYHVDIGAEFRGATPLRSLAAWHVLAATLRSLRAHLDDPDVLSLRPVVEALSDAYSGMRLAVLQHQRLGLLGFIQPILREGIRAQPALVEGVRQLASEGATPVAEELAAEVVSPKACSRKTRPRAPSSRRRP